MMNERIKELIEQCYNLPDTPAALYYRKFDIEKFARLMVRDCVQVAGDNATETSNPNIGMAKLEVVKAIIRHFGD